MEVTQDVESPKGYMYWAAQCAISAIKRRDVYLNMQDVFKLYPNIYVFLTGPSGLRKAFPLNLARRLAEEINNTRIYAGQMSIEAMFQDLAIARSMPDGRIMTDATGFIASEELAMAIIHNDDAFTSLIPIYDCFSDKFEKKLKGTGTETLKNYYLTLFGGINEEHFHDKIGSKEIFGGFIGRTMLIYEKEGGEPNSLMFPLKNKFDYASLVPGLKEINKLKGEMKLSPEAAVHHDEWYKKFMKAAKEDKMGIAKRAQTHILKSAMINALSDLSLTIEMSHLNEAETAVLERLGTIHRLTRGKGESKFAVTTKQLLTILLEQPDYRMQRSHLIGMYYQDFDVTNLPDIVETLKQAGYIVEEGSMEGITYKLNDVFVTEYKRRLANGGI